MSILTFRSSILFLFLISIYIYFQLFRLPSTPILFEGDHAVHLSNAWRMFYGEHAFLDFFFLHFPEQNILFIAFEIFGVKIIFIKCYVFWHSLSLSAIGLYFSRKILTGLAVYLPVSFF